MDRLSLRQLVCRLLVACAGSGALMAVGCPVTGECFVHLHEFGLEHHGCSAELLEALDD